MPLELLTLGIPLLTKTCMGKGPETDQVTWLVTDNPKLGPHIEILHTDLVVLNDFELKIAIPASGFVSTYLV